MEGENPTRRYKWFRPRQAYKSNSYTTATNFAAVGLFNGSTGDRLLVVRGVRVASFIDVLAAYDVWQRGNPNPDVNTSMPIIHSNPTPAGIVFVTDLASFPPGTGYQFNGAKAQDVWFEQDFPLAVVEPGMSYTIVSDTTGNDMSVSFVWEEITVDELDFLY